MEWKRIAAIAAAGTIGSFADWVFMGVLFHESYNRYPEIWRPGIRDGKDRMAIVWSSLLGYVMTAGVVGLCRMARVDSVVGGLLVALLAWIAGPVIILIVNGLFIKMDRKIVFAHGVGYLARMLLAGMAAGFAAG